MAHYLFVLRRTSSGEIECWVADDFEAAQLARIRAHAHGKPSEIHRVPRTIAATPRVSVFRDARGDTVDRPNWIVDAEEVS